MRRNLAPSQRSFSSPLVSRPLMNVQPCNVPPLPTPTPSANKIPDVISSENVKQFSVVWCKKSTRKHKKWEGDAILIVKQDSRIAILKELDGTEIGRGTSLPHSMLASLESGGSISFSGKDIEIMDELQPDAVNILKKSAKEEKAQANKSENESASSVLAAAMAPAAPFKRPFAQPSKMRQQQMSNQAEIQRSMFDITGPNAIVMPRPPPGFYDSTAHIVDVVLDPHLCKHLRPHQRDGVIFLYESLMGFRTPNSYGAILADEMGLGKTLQSICILWTMLKQGPNAGRPVIKRALVLAPSSLVKNWQAEFEKWLGNERIMTYAVDQNTKIGEYAKNPRHPVVIMSYDMFIRSTDFMENISFDLLICDEGHRLKNNQIKASQGINQMSVDRRLVLTGTPLQNDLKEFFAIVNLVSPGCLGSQASFTKMYEEPIVASKQPAATPLEIEKGEEKAEDLNHLTSQFILRRTQDIISKYLPPKVESVLFCYPSSLQSYLYEGMTGSLNSDLDIFMDSKFVLSSIMTLRRICNHPSLFLDDENRNPKVQVPEEMVDLTHEEQGSKLALVSALLWSLRQKGSEKIVLVSISTRVLDLLQALCTHYQYSFLRLDGSTTTTQRQQVVSRFNNPHCSDFVLLLSSKAGGTGLNLIGASRILMYDMDWNPANDIQAMARVWRDGQRRKVYIYRLVTCGTIEEKIFQRQLNKQGLGGGILDPEKQGASQKFHFTKDELKDLFTFHGYEPGCQTHGLLGCDCPGDGSTGSRNEDKKSDNSSRSCQLSLPSSSAPSKNQVQDLMQWKHLDPTLDGILADDPVLQDCANYLAFVFRNETQNG